MTEPTQEQKEALAAKLKLKADNKARRDAYRSNIGKTFTDGDVEAVVTGFDKDHLVDGIRGETFTYHLGNPNLQRFIHCEDFLGKFQLKGAQ